MYGGNPELGLGEDISKLELVTPGEVDFFLNNQTPESLRRLAQEAFNRQSLGLVNKIAQAAFDKTLDGQPETSIRYAQVYTRVELLLDTMLGAGQQG